MSSLSIEQKIQQHGYQHADSVASGPGYINLGGFAISFEDLLQRVGARIEDAFTAADAKSGVIANAKPAEAGVDHRDFAPERDNAEVRPTDDNRDNTANDKGRQTAENRESGAERPQDDVRGDSSSDHRADAGDDHAGDDHAVRESSNQNDSDSNADANSNDQSAEGSADNGNDGEGQANANAENAEQGGENANNGAEVAGQQANVNHAAAIYAAGVIGKASSESAQSGNVKEGEQAAVVRQAVDGVLSTVANTANRQNNHGSQNAGQQNANAAQANTQGAEQRAANADLKGQNANIQNQAQQLSRMIGSENRSNITVNLGNESNQVTSKPVFTVANGSILTQDGINASQSGQQSQNGQQQGQGQQAAQQAQLAAQQQAQAAQQSNAQNALQSAGNGSGNANSNATSAIQSAGSGAQHAGGGDAANNGTPNANAANGQQQAQQARETAPQQQAQQAARSNMPGSNITEQISVKITKALQAGTDRISIQLKPAELGRVDVKMEMTHDGRIMTVVTAEKQDTLDLLRRDSSELQRALADAGLNAGDMEFNLKGQEQQTAENENDTAGAGQSAGEEEAELENEESGVVTAWESGIFANGRLDMRA